MILRRPRSRRQPAVLALVGAVVAIAFLATPAPVGAVFTADATVGTQSIGTAVVADLSGGAATLSTEGEATVSWNTPSGDAHYAIERTVGGVGTMIAPTFHFASATTSFVDPLVSTPSDGTCATGWALASNDRCVPAGTVSYRIAYTRAGWSPPNALSLAVASSPSPTVTTTSTHVADVFRLGVQITNPSAVEKSYTVRFPTRVGVGVLVNVVPGLVGHNDDGWYATMTVGAGQTRSGEIRWRGAAAGDVIELTTSDGVAPRVETSVVVP